MKVGHILYLKVWNFQMEPEVALPVADNVVPWEE